MKRHEKRDWAIRDMRKYMRGATYAQLGRIWKLSVSRVWQIVNAQ